MLHRLPDNVSLELGALVEPMSVAYHAATLGDVRAGDTAMVFGAGPIGIGLWFALRGKGIEDVFVVEPSATRRASIEALGARTLDPAGVDVPDFIAEHTRGRGAGAGPLAEGGGRGNIPQNFVGGGYYGSDNRAGDGKPRVSPDGKTEAIIRDSNIWTRPAGSSEAGTALSLDGARGNALVDAAIESARTRRPVTPKG